MLAAWDRHRDRAGRGSGGLLRFGGEVLFDLALPLAEAGEAGLVGERGLVAPEGAFELARFFPIYATISQP